MNYKEWNKMAYGYTAEEQDVCLTLTSVACSVRTDFTVKQIEAQINWYHRINQLVGEVST